MNDAATRTPTFWHALVPVGFLILFLAVQIRAFDGTPHLPLILASIVAALV